MTVQALRRGFVVTVAASGVYSGKPRPAVPLVRLDVTPSRLNGLYKPSQLMLNKLLTVPMQAIGAAIGPLEPGDLAALDQALRDWLSLT